ncbi:hypothetical protein SSBR45G_45720 [Bradyrhizobium sp. SSBR45G]|uniref:hypothetical protein n=1 Tax=unclassified Bradyrhizobium TaxID=2631580 RepID=UPI0023428D2A|nr:MULTISPECIES: hypothetical protein [unclassified Bradyrhizobium]GLH79663.1 hypothetical protein SSBR45G_45720 [Bradyrhizobium sp. SSBR45G]GLH86942.1 hypothetical protein SSBR45R_44020 [Bradyrhizobium sp. SSBR45R]
MEERTWAPIVLLFFIAPIWLIAMWAMVMMKLGALRNEGFTLRLLTGYFVLAPYNRKYFRTFAGCIAILVGFGIVVNVLIFSGTLRLSNSRIWPTPTANLR